MKNNTWGKTILSVYKFLDRVSEAIDKLVKQNAFNSFYFVGQNQSQNSVMAVADRILELTERKKRLINVRVLADKALLECDRHSAQILIEKYMDGDSSQAIAERHNLNIRTYFRHLLAAEEKFCGFMSKFGYDEKKLQRYLAGEKWIMEIYQSYKEQEMAEEQIAI
ncbi:MAG: hypothetical protein J6A28_01655 [Clostridia bacterium]|nr:hypothetical protein [Clostridia bacterium]